MKIHHEIRWPLLLLPLVLTLSLRGAAAAGAAFPVATNPLVEFAGGVAFDGTSYLVGMAAGTNVAGQRLSGEGEVFGSPIVVGSNPGFPPAVAMAGAANNCLVAWSDGAIGSGVSSFGQLISPSTGPLGPAFPLLSAPGSHGLQLVQAAASDGTNFLVIWQDAATADFYGQIVTGSGALSGAEFLLFAFSGDVGDRNLAVTFGRTNYLVVWQSGENNTNDTWSALVSPSGVVGSAFQVNATSSLDYNPLAVGFDGTNYLVVWNRSLGYGDSGEPLWKLCGRLVSSAGVALGDELVLVNEHSSFPALAFDGDNYLLAWGYHTATTNTDTTIHARFLNRSAKPIGPVITPFLADGTNPPLLPLNGVFFDGERYVLTATFGAFILDGMDGIVGFSGGDVFGRFLPASGTAPVFTNSAVLNGQFQGELRVVPGQTYTIETSTNLLSWTPVGTVSSDAADLLPLIDEAGIASADHLFYRAVVGNLAGASFGLHFVEFAHAGGFGGGFTPVPSFPVSLDSYFAAFDVTDEYDLPDTTNVFFTGPGGSGLSLAAADPDNSRIGLSEALYQSPVVSSPAAAPGGVWTVNYHGTNITFNVPDPQAASRLVVPLPTATVSGGMLQSVSWVYKDAATGATLPGAPAYVTGIQVQIEGIVGGRIYESPELDPGTVGHALASTVDWSNVQTVHMAYNDSLGNHYVVSFSIP